MDGHDRGRRAGPMIRIRRWGERQFSGPRVAAPDAACRQDSPQSDWPDGNTSGVCSVSGASSRVEGMAHTGVQAARPPRPPPGGRAAQRASLGGPEAPTIEGFITVAADGVPVMYRRVGVLLPMNLCPELRLSPSQCGLAGMWLSACVWSQIRQLALMLIY